MVVKFIGGGSQSTQKKPPTLPQVTNKYISMTCKILWSIAKQFFSYMYIMAKTRYFLTRW